LHPAEASSDRRDPFRPSDLRSCCLSDPFDALRYAFPKLLQQCLREAGYEEGKNVTVEYRWAEERYDRLPDLAAELVRLDVDVILTHGTPATLALKQATTTIPIVMATSGDADHAGLVASLAHPGGNVTGMSYSTRSLASKRIELLQEVLPAMKTVGFAGNLNNKVQYRLELAAMQAAAPSTGTSVREFQARSAADFPGMIAAMVNERIDAAVLQGDGLYVGNPKLLAELTLKARLPCAGEAAYAREGGLIGYSPNYRDMFRRAARTVARILKGERARDLPVEHPTKFELVLSGKTANVLGIRLPTGLTALADEVVE
jgi:putative ABC transport system substrate-binding protein